MQSLIKEGKKICKMVQIFHLIAIYSNFPDKKVGWSFEDDFKLNKK